jgi:error-prone DNA polymerase
VGKLAAFANFGFPESHAVSFAYLVYSSAWLKLHYPAAFCAGLLNAQPMGFWSPQSLVADARRHGVTVLRPHVDVSGVEATLEWDLDGLGGAGDGVADDGRQPAVRLGLTAVRGIGEAAAQRIDENRPYSSVEDLVRRTGTGRPLLEALATAGALEGLAPRDGGPEIHERRRALWAAGALAYGTAERLPGLVSGEEAPPLPDLTPLEEVEADMWATGLTVGTGAVELARPRLDAMGVIPAGRLSGAETDGRVWVGGVVTHRQRPESAKGTVFLNLEDETGMVNVICSPGAWERWRPVARGAPALLVRGRLERVDGVVSLVAEKIVPLDLGPATVPASRDFR